MNRLLTLLLIISSAFGAQAHTGNAVNQTAENEFSIFIGDFMRCRAEARSFLNKQTTEVAADALTVYITKCLSGSASYKVAGPILKECSRRYFSLEAQRKAAYGDRVGLDHFSKYLEGCRQNYEQLIVEDMTIAL